MASDLTYVSVKLTRDELVRLNRVRNQLQEKEPERVVTRTDAIRHCITTASSTAAGGLEPVRVAADTKPKKI